MGRKSRGPSPRERLIDTAMELFEKDGFHATGIDTILEKSGVAKRTLYTHFRSKEELVLAALRHHDGLFRNNFVREVEGAAESPKGRLLAVFDVAERWFMRRNFYGCMFINATGEYSERDTPIRRVCKDFKGLMKGYLRTLSSQAGAGDPDGLGEELALLLEGAIVTAQVSQQPQAAQTARRAAEVLIEKARSGGVDSRRRNSPT